METQSGTAAHVALQVLSLDCVSILAYVSLFDILFVVGGVQLACCKHMTHRSNRIHQSVFHCGFCKRDVITKVTHRFSQETSSPRRPRESEDLHDRKHGSGTHSLLPMSIALFSSRALSVQLNMVAVKTSCFRVTLCGSLIKCLHPSLQKRVCQPRIVPKIPILSSATDFSRCHFHVVFLNFPHNTKVCVGELGWHSNGTFWNELPKHAFLSHTPLAPSLGLSADLNSGAPKVFLLNRDAQHGSESVKSQDNTDSPVTVSASVSVRRKRTEDTSQNQRCCIFQRSLCTSCIGDAVFPVIVAGRQTRPFSHSPSLHLLLNVPIFVW